MLSLLNPFLNPRPAVSPETNLQEEAIVSHQCVPFHSLLSDTRRGGSLPPPLFSLHLSLAIGNWGHCTQLGSLSSFGKLVNVILNHSIGVCLLLSIVHAPYMSPHFHPWAAGRSEVKECSAKVSQSSGLVVWGRNRPQTHNST